MPSPREHLDHRLRSLRDCSTTDKAHSRPLIVGILNVTPDSFSDGGTSLSLADALAAAHRLAAEGADVIDIGAESTRPGSLPVPPDVQLARLQPLLARLQADRFSVPLTIDTTSAQVAATAIELGAAGINDISAGLADPGMLPLVARTGVAYVLMHMQGTPATMQLNPTYTNVLAEVTHFLTARIRAATDAGVLPHRLIADPGLGFGKTIEHNLALLHNLRTLVAALAPTPVLIGASRKGFLSKLARHPDGTPPAQRLHATTATTLWSTTNGAALLRVHDVAAALDAIHVNSALTTGHL